MKTNRIRAGFLILTTSLLLISCAPAQKPLTLNAPYKAGEYQVAYLDIQPSQKILDSIDPSVPPEKLQQEWVPQRAKFLNILLPKFAGKGGGPQIGATVYIDAARFKSLSDKMGIFTTVLLWDPQTKAQIGELQVNHNYVSPANGLPGGGIEKTLGTMIANGISSGDQEAMVMEQYSDVLVARLFPEVEPEGEKSGGWELW